MNRILRWLKQIILNSRVNRKQFDISFPTMSSFFFTFFITFQSEFEACLKALKSNKNMFKIKAGRCHA